MHIGFAKISGSSVKTTKGSPVGTALYMAPEQLAGAEADPRMDIYTMGIVLYKGVTGVHPIGRTAKSVIMAMVTVESTWQRTTHALRSTLPP